MKLLPALALVAAGPLHASETRQLDAHEHGVGNLNIAIEGARIAIELEAPGADIVGFEHRAETAADRAAVDAAIAALARPLDLFILPEAANCSVVEASAALESEAGKESGSHDHDHNHDHAHDHHHHDDETGHSEFHAEYTLNCDDPAAITEMGLAYFTAFPNALKLRVQVISDVGATGYEVERAAPVLDLRGMF